MYTLEVGVEHPVFKKMSISAKYGYSWQYSNEVSRLNVNAQPFCFYTNRALKDTLSRLALSTTFSFLLIIRG